MTLRPPRGGLLLWKVAIFPPKLPPPPRSFSGGRKNQLHCSQSHTLLPFLLPPQRSHCSAARFINSGLFFTSSPSSLLSFRDSVPFRRWWRWRRRRQQTSRLLSAAAHNFISKSHQRALCSKSSLAADRHPITIPQIIQREELFLPFCMLHQISSP